MLQARKGRRSVLLLLADQRGGPTPSYLPLLTLYIFRHPQRLSRNNGLTQAFGRDIKQGQAYLCRRHRCLISIACVHPTRSPRSISTAIRLDCSPYSDASLHLLLETHAVSSPLTLCSHCHAPTLRYCTDNSSPRLRVHIMQRTSGSCRYCRVCYAFDL